jgi:hypothetical protein
MAKHRTSLLITVETDQPVKPTLVAKLARIELTGQEIWQSVACGRKAIKVTKVSVQHPSEK